jgi:hypothetical protein
MFNSIMIKSDDEYAPREVELAMPTAVHPPYEKSPNAEAAASALLRCNFGEVSPQSLGATDPKTRNVTVASSPKPAAMGGGKAPACLNDGARTESEDDTEEEDEARSSFLVNLMDAVQAAETEANTPRKKRKPRQNFDQVRKRLFEIVWTIE